MSIKKSLPCDEPSTLVQRTIELVNQDSRKVPELCMDLGVPLHWMLKFSKGDITSPNVNRVQYIYEKLTGSELPLS